MYRPIYSLVDFWHFKLRLLVCYILLGFTFYRYLFSFFFIKPLYIFIYSQIQPTPRSNDNAAQVPVPDSLCLDLICSLNSNAIRFEK